MENYVEVLDDEMLQKFVGGTGYIKTLTKDCPNVISGIDITIGGITIHKDC